MLAGLGAKGGTSGRSIDGHMGTGTEDSDEHVGECLNCPSGVLHGVEGNRPSEAEAKSYLVAATSHHCPPAKSLHVTDGPLLLQFFLFPGYICHDNFQREAQRLILDS